MSLSLNKPILVIGGGKMGSALIEGWLEAGLDPKLVFVVEPDAERRRLMARSGIQAVADRPDVPADLSPEAIMIAIKPQHFDAVLPAYRDLAGVGTMILSIAAGRLIAGIEAFFGEDHAVVRAMPNTPAAIGRGITVLCANPATQEPQRALATGLLAAVGETIWVEAEDLMHAVTALSGGGPAYAFLLVETLARAGSSLGLPDDMAMRLARRTIEGSGALMASSEKPASILRAEVTSPGGTTQAALRVLMGDHGFQELCDKALAEAEKRSRELA